MSKFITLEDVLGKDAAEPTELKKSELTSATLGLIPFTALEHAEYKQAKKDCVKFVPDGTGGMQPEVDDDKLMLRVIQAAVNKDDRSTFTFQDKRLLEKLKLTTGDQATAALLNPGEIVNFAVAVQNLSGFGKQAQKANEAAVKNSLSLAPKPD